jgi:hypothetical protein
MDCSLARLIITLRLTAPVPAPFALFGLRTPFRDAFRKLACRGTGEGVCERCRNPDCHFYRVFSQKVTDDPEGKKRHQKPPLPFTFGFPVLPSVPGEEFEVELILVGSALPFIADFVEALRRVMAEGEVRGEIMAVESSSRFGERSPLSPSPESEMQPILLSVAEFFTEVPPAKGGDVTFISPLRLVSNGRETNAFDFPLLLRTLLRRVSSILYYYCRMNIDDDFRWLSARCSEISVTSAGFGSDRPAGGIPGVRGTASFRGDISEIYPYLLLGEYLGAGKGAAFGYGRYSLRVGND